MRPRVRSTRATRLLVDEPARSGAVFDDADARYRYHLWRTWDPTGSRCAFVMLNPSVADETQDDPTIRRCIAFARAWGHGGLDVVNLFALRSTDPRALYASTDAGVDPVGPANDAHIARVIASASTIVCAWGAHGKHLDRDRDVLALLARAGRAAVALRVNRDGTPQHPLYVPRDVAPAPYADCAGAPLGRVAVDSTGGIR